MSGQPTATREDHFSAAVEAENEVRDGRVEEPSPEWSWLISQTEPVAVAHGDPGPECVECGALHNGDGECQGCGNLTRPEW